MLAGVTACVLKDVCPASVGLFSLIGRRKGAALGFELPALDISLATAKFGGNDLTLYSPGVSGSR